jgi:hypothetical protein
MKKIFYLSAVLLMIGSMLLSGCGGDGSSANEIMTKKLTAHSWELSSATVDGNDETALYDGLTITFTKTGFITTNGGVTWPASGTWEFVDKSGKTIIRNDDLEIEILEASKTTLKLSFFWDNSTFESGRVSSVGGDHVLTFVE